MTKTQVPSEPILIVCEGVTELRYLTELALFMGIEGKVDIRCSDLQNPEGTVERLAKERFWAKATGMPYAREVWLVFDRDRHVGYRSAVRIAERLGMRLALTRPCIEYWFLLHFAKGNIDFEKNGRVIYSVQKHAETDESGVITETVVTRYEPVAMPDACLAALKRLAPWYSKTKISFLSYFATRTKRAYARARALGNDLCSHGSGIPEIIDRFCELAGISPEDLFESFDQAVKESHAPFSVPDVEDRFMPPDVGHIGAMIGILAKGEREIFEEEWRYIGNTAERLAAWARRIVMIRSGTPESKEVLSAMQSDAAEGNAVDLEAAATTLKGIIVSHDGDFGKMTNACLQTLYGVLCNIELAVRQHIT